jgi:Flp pilus assembly protein CpaB
MTYRLRNVAIAMGLALVAMLLTLFYVINYRRSVQHQQATVQVYVAAHNIAQGTPGADLAHGHALKSVSVTRTNVVPGAISNPSEVSSLVVAQPLYAGEQVTLRRFTDVTAEGIVGQLKGTMRAVRVAGDPNQLLAGTLKTGDHVDVVANITVASAASSTSLTTSDHLTRIVLRDLPVLQTSGSATPTSSVGQQNSVILEVSDTQVQRLFFVMKNSDWTLELRPAIDASDSPERTDTLNSVVTSGVHG